MIFSRTVTTFREVFPNSYNRNWRWTPKQMLNYPGARRGLLQKEDDVERFMRFTGYPEAKVRTILEHYEWDYDRALQQYEKYQKKKERGEKLEVAETSSDSLMNDFSQTPVRRFVVGYEVTPIIAYYIRELPQRGNFITKIQELALEERRDLEQYFFSRDTLVEIVKMFDQFDNPCCLVCPSVAHVSHCLNRDVILLDIDER
eukprot:sb/3470631/